MISKFENEVMLKIIAENITYREKLTRQYKTAEVFRREFTGHGFFTEYIIQNKEFCLGEDINIVLGNISASLNDMEHGAGCVLFIKKGFISTLECYAYDEPFPDNIYKYEL